MGNSKILLTPKGENNINVLAFAQNTREEVRVLGDDGNIAGALSAESGTHQTTYVAIFRNVPRGTMQGI